MLERHSIIYPGDEFIIIPDNEHSVLRLQYVDDLIVTIVACDRKNKTFTCKFISDFREENENI